MAGETKRRFKSWFWQPPRPHGAVDPDRGVANLELFYDLVYVAVISQLAHRLAEDVSPRGVAEFAIVFAMIWLAWINGSLYLEIHGRQDGRTRLVVFVQMGILVLLAVFTSGAAGETGGAFAITYGALLVVLTWLWYSVRGQDTPEFRRITAIYVLCMVASIVVVLASAILPPTARLLVWAALCMAWVVACDKPSTTPITTSPRTMIVNNPKRSTIDSVGATEIWNVGRRPRKMNATTQARQSAAQTSSRAVGGRIADARTTTIEATMHRT